MRYIIFTPETKDELDNVYKSLGNISSELREDISILIWTNNQGVYLDCRENKDRITEGVVYREFLTLFGKDKTEIKDIISSSRGSVILVNPHHILGHGIIGDFYFSDRIYKYGFIAAQLHDECVDSLDLYDELSVKKSFLEGHDSIGPGVFVVDNTHNATLLIKTSSFKDCWLNDGNLGIYLRRLGFCNLVNKNLNIKRGK